MDEQPGGREHWNAFSAQKGACQCRFAICDSMRNTFSAQKSDGSSGGCSVRQLRHVSSPAAVSTAQKGECQCRFAISDSMRNTFSAQKSDDSSESCSVRPAARKHTGRCLEAL